MAEKKTTKKSEAELLREQLCYEPKNAGVALSDEEWEKADLFCEGYKKFLDLAKTEREAVEIAISMAREKGFTAFDPEKTYTVATIDYCVTGGGFRDVLKNSKVIHRGEVLYRDILVEYLEKTLGGHVSNDYAEPQGRIKIIQ